MGAKSGTKGKAAERELCKIASGIFGGSFVRSDSSGAYIGGKNSFRKHSLSESQKRSKKSDVVPPDHMPKFVIESKSYAEFKFHGLVQSGPIPQLEEWIGQCLQVIDDDDFWIIALKVSRIGWYVAVSEELVHDFAFTNYSVYVGGQYGRFRVTDLKEFCSVNREAILRLTA